MREGEQSAPYKQIWQSKAPPQISFFAWEAARECILTIDMLKRKGITLTKRCYLCKAAEEFCNHILLTCPAVYNIWSTVYGLMGLNWVISETVSKELWAWSGIFMRKKYLFLVPLAIFWVMWKEWNIRVFEGVKNDFVKIRDRWINTLILFCWVMTWEI